MCLYGPAKDSSCFIPNFAPIASPLTNLLKNDGFFWTNSIEDAFRHIQHALLRAPVLQLLDFNKPFTIQMDASGSGIGAVLLQDEHPIAYFNQKLAPCMELASAYDCEMFAITQAMTPLSRGSR